MKIPIRHQGEDYEVSTEQAVAALAGVSPEQNGKHRVVINGVSFPLNQAFAAVLGVSRVGIAQSASARLFRELGFERDERP
jgi:hypothetical protein